MFFLGLHNFASHIDRTKCSCIGCNLLGFVEAYMRESKENLNLHTEYLDPKVKITAVYLKKSNFCPKLGGTSLECWVSATDTLMAC